MNALGVLRASAVGIPRALRSSAFPDAESDERRPGDYGRKGRLVVRDGH